MNVIDPMMERTLEFSKPKNSYLRLKGSVYINSMFISSYNLSDYMKSISHNLTTSLKNKSARAGY